MSSATETEFQRVTDFWVNKFNKQGVQYTGRQGEDMNLQTKRVEEHIRQRLGKINFFDDGLDFGCGHGRFIPLLSRYCGHVWAVDPLVAALELARKAAPNVSAMPLRFPPQLPAKVDLVIAVFVFQGITDDALLTLCTGELKRVLKPGGRMIIIDNAQDRAGHVRPRGPQALGTLLGLKDVYSARVTVNQRSESDHWLIDGVKE